MKHLAAIVAMALMPATAGAETVRSETLELDLARRDVTMTNKSGGAIRGEQVYVTLRRLDGQPVAAGNLDEYVPFAERAACQGRQVLVSLIVGASEGAGRYEVLCSKGN